MSGKIISTDFREASRQRFLAECQSLDRRSTDSLLAYAPMEVHDFVYLSIPRNLVPAEQKLLNYQRRLMSPIVQGSPARQEKIKCLMAGVIVMERVFQCREWLEADRRNREEMLFPVLPYPRLDIVKAVGAGRYKELTARLYPAPVRQALELSAALYGKIEKRSREMQNAPPDPGAPPKGPAFG